MTSWQSATLMCSLICSGTAFQPASINGLWRRQGPVVELAAESEGDSSALFSVDSISSSSTLNATSCVSTTLFADDDSVSNASFGDVVRPKYLSSPPSSEAKVFEPPTTIDGSASIDEVEAAARLKRRNLIVAIASIAVALLNYFWQFTHPISPVQLLLGMEQASVPLSVIGNNGKPTVVDFWAPVRGFCLGIF